MKRLHYYLSISLSLFLMVSNTAFSQQKELDKLKSLIKKGNMDKAQAYCDKVTAPLGEKKAARFYGLLANGYYKNKDYVKAAKMVEKSTNYKLSAKLAKQFENSEYEFHDVNVAIKLYKKGKNYEQAAKLLFREGKYEEAATTCPLADANMKYGDSLFDKGKVDESLYFYKRAKKKGAKFSAEKVLDYYYKRRAYAQVYAIQNYNEGDFKMQIQGSVIDKMFEQNEPVDFVKKFLDSLGIVGNKQDEIIIEGFINNKLFDEAEALCMELKNPEQQLCLSFMADKTSVNYPDVSASANFKLGRTSIAKNQLTTYLIETAKEYNTKWDKIPIDKNLLEAYYSKTKQSLQKCEQDYCEFLQGATKKCTFKADEFSKTNIKEEKVYTSASAFMQQTVLVYCN